MNKEDYIQDFSFCLKRRLLVLSDEIQEKIGAFFYLLHEANEITNLTGYTEIDEYVDFHLLDTVKLLEIIQPGKSSRAMDIGTGPGIPGIILKCLRPDLEIVMVETNGKKADFVNSVIQELKIDRCVLIKGRAEEIANDRKWREKSGIVIARALGKFSTTLELTAGFAEKEGIIALPKGAEEGIDGSEECFRILGCRLERTVEYTIPRRNKPFQVYFIKKVENLLSKYPRKPGQIRKRPL